MRNRYHDPALYKLAMDAALDLEQARKDCAPFIGDVDMNDCKSPSDLYEAVFTAKGVDFDGVDESAYPAMMKMLRQNPNAGKGTTATAAMDSKRAASLEADFPEVARIG